jgi:hypothetical protein
MRSGDYRFGAKKEERGSEGCGGGSSRNNRVDLAK